MKKPTSLAGAEVEVADAPATTPEASAPVPVEPVAVFDPAHEWPAQGGCYVRQTDGTLKIED